MHIRPSAHATALQQIRPFQPSPGKREIPTDPTASRPVRPTEAPGPKPFGAKPEIKNTLQLADARPATVKPSPVRPAIDPPPATRPEPLTMQGLLDAWGQSDSPYDFDGDGTVNTNDLLHFINNWDSLATQNNPQPHVHPFPPTPRPTLQVAPEVRVANSMYDQLSRAGFATQPPVNIHEMVDSLQLSPKQTDQTLKQMADKYPAGLGVNMVG